MSVEDVILQCFLTKLCPFFDLEFSCKNFDISNISGITEDI